MRSILPVKLPPTYNPHPFDPPTYNPHPFYPTPVVRGGYDSVLPVKPVSSDQFENFPGKYDTGLIDLLTRNEFDDLPSAQKGSGHYIDYYNLALSNTLALSRQDEAAPTLLLTPIIGSPTLTSGSPTLISRFGGIVLGTVGNDLNNVFSDSAPASYSFSDHNYNYDGKGGIDRIDYYYAKHEDLAINKTTTGYEVGFETKSIPAFGADSILGNILGSIPGFETKSIFETGTKITENLINIERLEFTDTKLALDLEGNAGTVAKIYGAVLGKDSISNKELIGTGLHEIDAGMSHEEFATAAIFATGLRTSEEIVTALWTNVVGSTPTSEQAQPYIHMLDAHEKSVGELGMLAADTSLNQVNIDLVGLTHTGIEYI